MVDDIVLLSVSNFLGLTVILANFIVKLPQIFAIFNSGSSQGLSLAGLLLEECGYSIMFTYHFAMDYPLLTYFEYALLLLQDLVLIMMVLYFSGFLNLKVLALAGIYISVFVGLALNMYPDFVLKIAIGLVTPLSVSSKAAQILTLYKKKDPGQVSLLSWCIASYGSTSRMITTAISTGDIAVMVIFVSASLLNYANVFTILYYKGKVRSKQE